MKPIDTLTHTLSLREGEGKFMIPSPPEGERGQGEGAPQTLRSGS
jgi:hypothetical protein